MEASDELLTIAELAIGLAGFSGVVVAFTQRGELRAADRYRFIALFSQALSVVFLAFVPLGFHHAGQVAPTVWTASSAVMLLVWVFTAWLLRVRLMPEFSDDERLPKYSVGVIWGIGILNPLLQSANVIGWPMGSGPLLYLAGLILWLSVTAFFFASLVLYRAKE